MDLKGLVRGWVALTLLMTVGNVLQSLDVKLLAQKLFDLQGEIEVTKMYGRLFAHWNIMLAVVRFVLLIYYDSKPLYLLCILTYLMSFLYFAMESLLHKSATVNLAIVANLAISGLSMLLMSFCWPHMFPQRKELEEKKPRGKLTAQIYSGVMRAKYD